MHAFQLKRAACGGPAATVGSMPRRDEWDSYVPQCARQYPISPRVAKPTGYKFRGKSRVKNGFRVVFLCGAEPIVFACVLQRGPSALRLVWGKGLAVASQP